MFIVFNKPCFVFSLQSCDKDTEVSFQIYVTVWAKQGLAPVVQKGMNTLAFFCFAHTTVFVTSRRFKSLSQSLFHIERIELFFAPSFYQPSHFTFAVEWQKFTHRSWICLRSTLFCLGQEKLFCRHICLINSSPSLSWEVGCGLTKEVADIVWLTSGCPPTISCHQMQPEILIMT